VVIRILKISSLYALGEGLLVASDAAAPVEASPIILEQKGEGKKYTRVTAVRSKYCK